MTNFTSLWLISLISLPIALAAPILKSQHSIATGDGISCAILENQHIKCWGENDHGQLGVGDLLWRGNQPNQMGAALPEVKLPKGRKAISIVAAGSYVCSLLDDQKVYCWGANSEGQLGLGDTIDHGSKPGQIGDNLKSVNLGTGAKVLQISAGYDHACAILTDGRLKCWGNNIIGQLGQGDSLARGTKNVQMGDNLLAVNLGTGRIAKQVVSGDNHTCALLDDSNIKCWGDNQYGQLGIGSSESMGTKPGQMGEALKKVELGTDKKVKSIASGLNHVCAALVEGSVKCWGQNLDGTLGLGDNGDRGSLPEHMGDQLPAVELSDDFPVEQIFCGSSHCCASLQIIDTLKCWGYNAYGQLGISDTTTRGDKVGQMGENLPSVDLGALRTATELSIGSNHTCARLNNGALKCWGRNYSGELGLGDSLARGGDGNRAVSTLPPIQL